MAIRTYMFPVLFASIAGCVSFLLGFASGEMHVLTAVLATHAL